MLFDTKEMSEIKNQRSVLQPSLNGGYVAVYHNKIPMDIKYVDYERNVKQVGGAQIMGVKIYSYGTKVNSTKIKIQVESQYDPFFNLIFQCDSQKYGYLRQQQGINADFQQFPTVLIRCFNKIEEQCCCRTNQNAPSKGKMNINLLVVSDGKAKLVINQSSQYKNIQVMALDMSPQNQQQTQNKVAYRYEQMTKKVEQAEARLAKIQQIIKLKNPTLLTQIFKTTHGHVQHSKLNISGI